MSLKFRALDSWWLDVKLGLRMLVKYPGLALAGGAGIAVAVALAAGGFSFIYSNFLVSGLPLDEGDRIVSVEVWDSAASNPEPRILYDFHLWRQELKSVQEISAFRVLNPSLIVPGAQPESIRVAAMTASGFGVARVRPLMGRYLQEQDERQGAPGVVVIGEDVWRNRFAGDPAILGRSIQLGSAAYEIVGVMPQDFAFPLNDHVWIPLRPGVPPAEPLQGPPLTVFGRLAPGVTLENAQAELSTVGRRTAQAFPRTNARLQPHVMLYARPFTGIRGNEDVASLLAMQGLFVCLLVLICLNVAILVYTRTTMRRAEIGVRTALGASRGRIVAQLFVEAFVLSIVAALAGIGLAALGLGQIAAATVHLAGILPFWMSFRLTPESVLYAVALSVFAAAIIGIVPALQATRRRAEGGFRVAGTEGLRLGKTWTVLIVAQVCFAVALLPPAVTSAWDDALDGMAGLGFPAGQYLSAELGMDEDPGPARFAARQTELLRRLQEDPRVAAVTFAMTYPGSETNARIEIEGSDTLREVRFNRVDPGFFRVFDVPVLAGRGFTGAETDAFILVNQPFAERIFGGNALGRRIRYVNAEPARWYEIAGIVPDFPTGASPGMRDTNLRIYHAAAPGQVQPASLAIRMRGGDPAAFAQPLREMAAAVDPDFHLRDIQALDAVMRSEQWISRMTAAAFVAITLSVLLLSSAGIYSLMSFTVSQRRKEIGIRMALGAGRRQIVASIFSRALLQLAAGAALGLGFGIAVNRATAGIIMRGNAAIALPAVAIVIMTVGFLAALGPTRRSLNIHPTEALREE